MKCIKKVLIVGNDVRNIAFSAKKAGYTVYAIDRFGDIDTQKCASKMHVLEKMTDNELVDLIKSFSDADAVILGQGFEHLKLKDTLNNSMGTMEESGNKSKLPDKLSSMNIPHPETVPVDKADEMEFPLIIKPESGSGGLGNFIVRDKNELDMFKGRNDPRGFIAQEFVDGVPCSASVISTGDDAVVVALNEQLIGLPWLSRLPFAYCGNVTPFHAKFVEDMVQYARQIALEFKLRGSNGVDFMQTDKGIQVIEINPRFQGSIDTIELSTGFNVFNAHIRSFAGELPEIPEAFCFAAKGIIYADKELVIERGLQDTLIKYMDKGLASDIPRTGTKVLPDEPVCTMLATAGTREMVLKKLEISVRNIKDTKGPTEV